MELTSKITKTEKDLLKQDKEKVYFHSNYDFLSCHKGFRPCHIHTILGNAGGGKSTLIRSLIIDVLCNRPAKKVLLWLSEETRLQFLTEFGYSDFEEFKNDNFLIYSEMDAKGKTPRQIFEDIEIIVRNKEVDILIYDNITTSKLYMDRTVAEQSAFCTAIKNAASRWAIPVVLVAHTNANITENYEKIINMNDIRGGKTLINLSEFFYILQTFYIESDRFMTLRITKHRGFSLKNLIYKLVYSPKARLIALSKNIPFDDFKEAYKQRNKL